MTLKFGQLGKFDPFFITCFRELSDVLERLFLTCSEIVLYAELVTLAMEAAEKDRTFTMFQLPLTSKHSYIK